MNVEMRPRYVCGYGYGSLGCQSSMTAQPVSDLQGTRERCLRYVRLRTLTLAGRVPRLGLQCPWPEER